MQGAAPALRREDVGDVVQTVERFPHREGEPRPDLQDREAVIDEGFQRRRGLVIGGMRLEDELRHVAQRRRETPRRGGIVGDYVGMTEFDAGLDHDTDRAGEGRVQPRRREGAAVDLDGGEGSLGVRHLQVVERMRGAARHRHFRADDIDRRWPTGVPCGALGRSGETRGAFGRQRVGQGRRFAEAAHRRVEVELRKARTRIGGDHGLRLLHRLDGRQGAPGVRPEMVAAENQPPGIEADLRRDSLHEGAEARGRHAGIAALLVHLIAGRLDEHGRVIGDALQQRRLDGQRMRGADRSNAHAPARVAQARDVGDGETRHGAILPA